MSVNLVHCETSHNFQNVFKELWKARKDLVDSLCDQSTRDTSDVLSSNTIRKLNSLHREKISELKDHINKRFASLDNPVSIDEMRNFFALLNAELKGHKLFKKIIASAPSLSPTPGLHTPPSQDENSPNLNTTFTLSKKSTSAAPKFEHEEKLEEALRETARQTVTVAVIKAVTKDDRTGGKVTKSAAKAAAPKKSASDSRTKSAAK